MIPIRYATACSGIDAPGTAWQQLGWRAVFHSEIDSFPCDVLAAREPDVPNLGNMEAITREQIEGFKPVSVFVAGTPCQSFSVAGLRKGMADPRGNLALVFLRLVDWLRPAWVVWENVPGVHSSWSDVETFAPSEKFRRDLLETRRAAESVGLDLGADFDAGNFEEADQSNDFDCFLAALEQLGYGVASTIFDAQHFGVPQRRRRVFVVGHLGDWRRAAAVLFERHSLSGHPAPSREAGARTAACLTRGADSSGKGGYAGRRREDDYNIVNAIDTFGGGPDDNSAQAGHLIASTGETSHCLNAGGMGRQDYETETLITHSLRANGFDASEDGTGRGTPLVPVGFTIHGTDKTVRTASPCDVAGSLRTKPPGSVENSSSTVVLQPSNVIPIDMRQASRGATMTNNRSEGACSGGAPGTGIGEPGDPSPSLSMSHPPAVAFAQNQRDEVRTMEVVGALAAEPGMKQQTYIAFTQNQAGDVLSGDTFASMGTNQNATGRNTPKVLSSGVRRLMPVECERLQGFPDSHTAVKHRGKPASDAPRYKAIGNSMCVNVMLWIGKRIQLVNDMETKGVPREV